MWARFYVVSSATLGIAWAWSITAKDWLSFGLISVLLVLVFAEAKEG